MSKKNKAIENTNAIDNDSNTESKERKTLNISLQKRNLELLNSIVDTWEKNGLVVSNEACNCILFKYDFENNPFLQTFLSRINLIKNNVDSKELYDTSYEDALNIALKNVLEIKINPTELVRLLEDDSYFKNIEEIPKKNNTQFKEDNTNSNINSSTVTITNTDKNNNAINNITTDNNSLDTSYTNDNHTAINKNIQSNNNNYTNENINTPKINHNKQTVDELAVEKYTNEEDNKESKPLVWNIPEPITDNQNSDLNEKLNAFSYNF